MRKKIMLLVWKEAEIWFSIKNSHRFLLLSKYFLNKTLKCLSDMLSFVISKLFITFSFWGTYMILISNDELCPVIRTIMKKFFYFKILRKVIPIFMKLPLKWKIFRKHYQLSILRFEKKTLNTFIDNLISLLLISITALWNKSEYAK